MGHNEIPIHLKELIPLLSWIVKDFNDNIREGENKLIKQFKKYEGKSNKGNPGVKEWQCQVFVKLQQETPSCIQLEDLY